MKKMLLEMGFCAGLMGGIISVNSWVCILPFALFGFCLEKYIEVKIEENKYE